MASKVSTPKMVLSEIGTMAENSGIGWTDHTMNFWWGCNHVSTECLYCYIGPLMRFAGKVPFNGPIKTVDWLKPDKWNRRAAKLGRRYRIFTCSMSDFFHPGADEWRPEAWNIIRRCTNLDWLILTKRPELVVDRLPKDWGQGYPNVWLGTTCGARSARLSPTEFATPCKLTVASAKRRCSAASFSCSTATCSSAFGSRR